MASCFQTTVDPEARVRVALFFALFPPPSAAARIAELGQQLQRVHRLKGTPTALDRLHCTLHGLDTERRGLDGTAARAREAAARVKAEPFDVVFDHTVSFRGSRGHPFVLRGGRGLNGLTTFRRALGAAMYNVELRDGLAGAYTPHVTLIYGTDRLVAEHPIRPIRWRVDAFDLVLSVHREGHQHLGRWVLGG